MAVLIIKNIITEGPGTIEDFLRKGNISFRIVELHSGEVPPSLEDFDSLVIMGGPMAVYEMDKYPHLTMGSRIIREAKNRDMRILGICLGAQMIAYCLGAEVYKGPVEEIGWYAIELTGDGLKDPLMRRLAIHPRVGDFWRRFKVFHWHSDTFDLPIGAVLLASSKLYKNQAFRYRDNVYGFQFHIEVIKDMLLEWFKNSPEINQTMEETEKIYEEYTGRAMNFYKAFFSRG
ncbi:MAG: type 1 glutamine amidotransferase [Nitrospirota bacterium]